MKKYKLDFYRSWSLYFYKSCTFLRSPEETNDGRKYLEIVKYTVVSIFSIQRCCFTRIKPYTVFCVFLSLNKGSVGKWKHCCTSSNLPWILPWNFTRFQAEFGYEVAGFFFETKSSSWSDKNITKSLSLPRCQMESNLGLLTST